MSAKHAFVLTGTGANAAYQVGVMQALLLDRWGKGREPVDPVCYCGTSIGALNAAVMVSRSRLGPTKALSDLRDMWLERVAISRSSSATGFFRLRAEPTQYMVDFDTSVDLGRQVRPMVEMANDTFYFMRETARRLAFAMGTEGTLADRAANMTELALWVDGSPMADLVRDTIDPGDFHNAPKRAAITAVNWHTGLPRTFYNADLARQHGRDIILAAGAIPAIFPPRLVEGKPYADAALLMDVPLGPALEALSDVDDLVIHAIYVDMTKTDVPMPPVSNTFASAFRLFMLALSRQVNADIDRASRMNGQIRTMRLFQSLVAGAGGRSEQEIQDEIAARLGPDASDVWQELSRVTRNKRLVTIHRHCPSKNAWGFEMAQFQRGTIQELIDNGYEDAMDHDCTEAGCIKVS